MKKRNNEESQEEKSRRRMNAAVAGGAGFIGGGMAHGAVSAPMISSIKRDPGVHGTNWRSKFDINPDEVDLGTGPAVLHPDLVGKENYKKYHKALTGKDKANPDGLVLKGDRAGMKGDYFMAHEYGHASKSNPLGQLNKKMYLPSKLLGTTSLGWAPGAAALAKTRKGRTAAVAAPWLAAAPMLAEEARASYRADKALKGLVSSKDKWKGRANLAKAFGTYAAIPGIASGMAYGIKRHRDKKEEEREKEKLKKKASYRTPKAADEYLANRIDDHDRLRRHTMDKEYRRMQEFEKYRGLAKREYNNRYLDPKVLKHQRDSRIAASGYGGGVGFGTLGALGGATIGGVLGAGVGSLAGEHQAGMLGAIGALGGGALGASKGYSFGHKMGIQSQTNFEREQDIKAKSLYGKTKKKKLRKKIGIL